MTWWVAGAVVVGAVVSSNAQKKAAKSAADASAAAAKDAAGVQRYIYDQTREDQTPWRDTGQSALNQLAMMMGVRTPEQTVAAQGLSPAESINSIYQRYLGRAPDESGYANYLSEYQSGVPLDVIEQEIAGSQEAGEAAASGRVSSTPQTSTQGAQSGQFGSLMKPFSMADYQADPGYQFQIDEGRKAIERSAASHGGLYSGRSAKDLMRFSQGLASNEYQNAFNRYQSNQSNQYNRLASLAGVGQTANNALAQSGQNYANAYGNIAMGNAANQGNAALAIGNARASAYQGIGNAFGRANWGGGGGGATYSGGASGNYGDYNQQASQYYNSSEFGY